MIAGGVLLLLGLIQPLSLYLRAPRVLRPIVWSAPIAGEQLTARYTIELKENAMYSFAVSVDEENKSATGDPVKVDCLLGGIRDDPDSGINCKQHGPPLGFRWRVTGPGGVKGEGRQPVANPHGTLDQEDRKRELIGFGETVQLAPGDYILEIGDLHVPPELAALHPAFEMTLENDHYDYYKDWMTVFYALASGAVALVGLVLLVLGLIPGAISRK